MSDNNILVEEYNKISKYKNLEIETEKIWHLKTTVAVIVGALHIIKKGTEERINKIPGSLSLFEIQKKNCTLRNSSSSS